MLNKSAVTCSHANVVAWSCCFVFFGWSVDSSFMAVHLKSTLHEWRMARTNLKSSSFSKNDKKTHTHNKNAVTSGSTRASSMFRWSRKTNVCETGRMCASKCEHCDNKPKNKKTVQPNAIKCKCTAGGIDNDKSRSKWLENTTKHDIGNSDRAAHTHTHNDGFYTERWN